MLRKIVNGTDRGPRGHETTKTLMNTGVRTDGSPTPWMRAGVLSLVILFAPAIHSLAVTESTEDFELARPGYRYEFPKDHGAHERFRTEWWYYTGQVTAADGRRYGYQLTFFRRGIPPAQVKTRPSEWSIRQLYLAHFTITDLAAGRFLTAEKVSRAGLGKAGAERDRLRVWIDRWSVTGGDTVSAPHSLQASTEDMAIELTLTPQKPPVVHGGQGVSRKGDAAGQTSHYYSLTRLATHGQIRIGTERFAVTGLSWMDHEFGSADLGETIVGWDWFSLQLSNHTELMWYRLRRTDGQADAASSGTVILADGSTRHLKAQDATIAALAHWTSARSGARYPQRWRVTAPSIGLDLEVTSLQHEQELQTPRSTQVTYWEGAVSTTGTVQGVPVSGEGYVELTGYAKRFTQRL